jgi:two-component system CheB/CheR fusion protein
MPSVSENDRKTSRPGPLARFSVAHVATEPRTEAESAAVRYGVATVAVGISLLASLWLVPFSYTTPFLLLYPAVLLAAWFGGLGPGLFATIIASVAVNYFLLPPYNHFSLDASNIVRTVFFALTFGTVCWLTELARRHVYSRSELAKEQIQELNQALRQRNAELDAERARWQGVVESIADEVWVCDARGKISLLNLPAVTHAGLEEFRDKSMAEVLEQLEILHADGRPRPPEQSPLFRSLRGEIIRGEEVMRHRASGKMRYRQFSSAPTRDASGAITGAVAIVRDITDAKQTEQQLQLQSTALESAANAIVITDSQGAILWINPAFTEMTGYTAGEVLGRTPRVLASGQHEPQFYANMWATILSGSVWHGEVVNRRKNGSLYVEEMTITPVRSERGEISHFIAIKVDVSERKRSEQALIRSEKLAATGRLAATIAHEINNPLEAMTNLLYLIGPAVTEPAAREYYDLMKKQLQAVSRIASQTLNFHRENSRPANFSLSEVISESLEFYQPKARKHGVAISGRLETGAVLVGFSGEIRQVVSNLLLNAIEATPAGGSIIIHLRESCDWRNPARRGFRITVLDTGCGIDPLHRARIFEQGTGLGLWVSFGIVQRAGGSMRVWSARRPGRTGTCFSVFLPTEVPAAAGPARRRYEAVQAPDTPTVTG